MNPTIQILADRGSPLRLSDTVIITVVVEGVAPLRVQVPKEKDILSGESAKKWRVVAVGAPKTESLPSGQARWSQEYRFSPFATKSLPIEFTPFQVKAGPVSEAVMLPDYRGADQNQLLHFEVEAAQQGMKVEDTRPITTVEEVRPEPVMTAGLPAVWAIAGGVVLVSLAAVYARFCRRRSTPILTPLAEALLALEGSDSPPTLELVAGTIRRFLYRSFGLPIETATTIELIAILRGHSDLTDERLVELDELLQTCDLAKYAGWTPGEEVASQTLDRARAWLAEAQLGSQ